MKFLTVLFRKKGLTTPERYFSSKTKEEVEKSFIRKYGPPTHTPPYKMVWFDKEIGRSFVLHEEAGHHGDKPHVDISVRGSRRKRKPILLREK